MYVNQAQAVDLEYQMIRKPFSTWRQVDRFPTLKSIEQLYPTFHFDFLYPQL